MVRTQRKGTLLNWLRKIVRKRCWNEIDTTVIANFTIYNSATTDPGAHHSRERFHDSLTPLELQSGTVNISVKVSGRRGKDEVNTQGDSDFVDFVI